MTCITFNKWLHHAKNGDLEAIKILHQNNINGISNKVIDVAAKYGHLHIVEWLDSHTTANCSEYALDEASSHGHFKVVMWLHFNRKKSSYRAFDNAAKNGHLNIIKFLNENRINEFTTKAMDNAIINVHLHVVRWLYKYKPECYKHNFILLAIEHKQWEILDWYDNNIHENFWVRLKRKYFIVPKKKLGLNTTLSC